VLPVQQEILSERDVSSVLFSVPTVIPFKLFKEIADKVEEQCRFFLVKNKRKLLHSSSHKTVTQSTPSALVIVLAKENGWRRPIKRNEKLRAHNQRILNKKGKSRVALCLVYRTPSSSTTYKTILNKF
jgi:hypothetical protein